ncbi:MAG: WD40/YVTN/BNR-like repeat-containing protein, partial [bacterium]
MTLSHRIALHRAVVVASILLLPLAAVVAQQPARNAKGKSAVAMAATAGDAKLRGVWEPVSYPEDVHLNDVYFATPDIGWVTAGSHGTPGMIIHTRDGGASWTAQLGDPESSDPAFHDLRFIDAHHGWVLQDASSSERKLLHTSNGLDWSQVGTIERHWGVPDYEFTSPQDGLYIDGNDNVSRIMRTSDGGRIWTEVYKCAATIQVEGLTKKVACALKTLHFPTPRVGYAIGGAHGAKRTLFVA